MFDRSIPARNGRYFDSWYTLFHKKPAIDRKRCEFLALVEILYEDSSSRRHFRPIKTVFFVGFIEVVFEITAVKSDTIKSCSLRSR